MTRQQAGVSADVAELLRRIDEDARGTRCLTMAEVTLCLNALKRLATAPPDAKPISAWIEQQQQTTPREMATAPPEQAARPTVSGASPVCLDCNKAGLRNCSHFDNCDGTWVYKPDPQAVSAGALSAGGWALETMQLINKLTPDIKEKAFDPDWFLLRQRLEEFESRLAAHDQKVREPLAAWMIQNSFATGHGDTVEDLLKELKWQIEERKQKVREQALKEELAWLEVDWPPIPKTDVARDWAIWAFNLDQYHRAHMAEIRRALVGPAEVWAAVRALGE